MDYWVSDFHIVASYKIRWGEKKDERIIFIDSGIQKFVMDNKSYVFWYSEKLSSFTVT